MLDTNIWMGVIVLTILLYTFKWWLGRIRKVKVYRVSPESLKRAKEVVVRVLSLVEDGETFPLDERRLAYPKEDVKSAAKIMAYYFWKKRRQDELSRVKNCFVSLARFQDIGLDLEAQERRASRERVQLERELNYYMTHAPFSARRSG
ncbi:hypothetical protein BerOc1_01417 [Pseudodesulfovibrio hydrargyri]|uniref:Uncharacterized protein n=1 Tax=Pseudodesulfovibrio hydrargyri TaxID=2125990 RepID=A0A1J5MUH1_9BACT|nr:hypothetical protein [Pseudodesulfovibrio hydrargyri]OIQ49492.1 hypothetical protein BerOc1_01417 [Pseudodesulfovibrio hydrargyri]